MKKILLIIFGILSVVCLSAQAVTTLRIDPDNAQGGTVSQIFDSVTYIPLETTNESIFGIIHSLIVTPTKFIIYDNTTNGILIFDRKGKFVSKINSLPGAKKYGAGFGTLFSKVSYDFITHQIIVSPSSLQLQLSNKFFYFDTLGNLIKTVKYDTQKFEPETFESLGSNRLLLRFKIPNDIIQSKAQKYTYGISKNNSLETGFVPHDSLFYMTGEDLISGSGNQINLNYNRGKQAVAACDYFSDSIYLFDTSGVIKTFKLLFPYLRSLPGDFITDHKYDMQRYQFIKDHPDVIYSIGAIFCNDDWLSLHFATIKDFPNKQLLINLKNERVYAFNRIEPDSLSYYLPVYSGNFTGYPVIYDNKMYNSIPSYELVSAYKEAISNKRLKNEGSVAHIMDGMTRKSNPVIVQLKLKENL